MAASCGFSRVSCGFVGASDGWHDLMDHSRMEWEFGSATNGNIAVMGEIDLHCAAVAAQRCSGRRGIRVHGGIRDRRGAPHSSAADDGVAGGSVCGAKGPIHLQWARAANPEWLAAKSGDGGKLMRASHNVLAGA
jgi:glucoamylase